MEDLSKSENIPDKEVDWKNLKVGDKFLIENKEYAIERVESATDMALEYGLKINRYVPVYFIDGIVPRAHGSYYPEVDIVLIYKNMTDLSTLKHEFIHVIEYYQEPTPSLLDLYNKAKEIITENSFNHGLFRFNFMKNIHEFIADGKTNFAFIEALKKEGLYEDFEKEVAYLFE
jgi:hypothetical protein